MAQVRLLVDGYFTAPRKTFLPGEPGKYVGVAKSLLIQSGSEKILVDTGIGEIPTGAQYADMKKSLAIRRTSTQGIKKQLARAGLRPEQITMVVNSHLHVAHAGNNKMFTNAKFYVSKSEFRFIDQNTADDPNQTAYIRERFEGADYIELKGGKKVTEEVEVLETPGHTLGHQSVVVRNGTSNLIYSGDVSPLKQNLLRRYPMTGYDRDQILASMNKLLAIRNAKWIFSHDNRQLTLRSAYKPT
jgi:N-acyl homoserine lactone hydrolase